jgi:hypothetical protein
LVSIGLVLSEEKIFKKFTTYDDDGRQVMAIAHMTDRRQVMAIAHMIKKMPLPLLGIHMLTVIIT